MLTVTLPSPKDVYGYAESGVSKTNLTTGLLRSVNDASHLASIHFKDFHPRIPKITEFTGKARNFLHITKFGAAIAIPFNLISLAFNSVKVFTAATTNGKLDGAFNATADLGGIFDKLATVFWAATVFEIIAMPFCLVGTVLSVAAVVQTGRSIVIGCIVFNKLLNQREDFSTRDQENAYNLKYAGLDPEKVEQIKGGNLNWEKFKFGMKMVSYAVDLVASACFILATPILLFTSGTPFMIVGGSLLAAGFALTLGNIALDYIVQRVYDRYHNHMN